MRPTQPQIPQAESVSKVSDDENNKCCNSPRQFRLMSMILCSEFHFFFVSPPPSVHFLHKPYLPSQNIIWTEPKRPQAILAARCPKYPVRVNICALERGSDSPSCFDMMHVVAEVVFFLQRREEYCLISPPPRHATNGHFHVAALAKLTNASTPSLAGRPEIVEKRSADPKQAAGRFLSAF